MPRTVKKASTMRTPAQLLDEAPDFDFLEDGDTTPFGGDELFSEMVAGMREELGHLLPDSKYSDFKAKYWFKPDEFANDCIEWPDGKKPAFYQLDIMRELVQHGRKCARGPRGLGKTTISAILVLWFSLTRDGKDWKIPTTAGSHRQLTKFLWPEIHKWARRLKWDEIGRPPFNERTELLAQTLKLSTGEAFGVVSDNSDLIEGAHGDHILFVYDESKAIPEKTFDASEGTFSNAGHAPFPLGANEAYLLAVSTPGLPNGRFYDIQSRKPGYEDWHVTRVTLEDTIKAGMLDSAWAESRRRQWGETSQVYQNHVLGEFAADESVGFIPLADVERAMELYDEWVEACEYAKQNNSVGPEPSHSSVGADVGDGSDKNTLAFNGTLPEGFTFRDKETGERKALRAKRGIYELRESRERGVMPVAGSVKNVLDHRGGVAVIDKNGVGAGAVGRLKEQGYGSLVIPFNGQSTQSVKGLRDQSGEIKPGNMRSWGYIKLRELLNPANGHFFMLPSHDELKGDLTIPKAKPLDSDGRLFIESKKDIKKTLGRSTDYGDAVMMAIMGEGDGKRQPLRKPSRSFATY